MPSRTMRCPAGRVARPATICQPDARSRARTEASAGSEPLPTGTRTSGRSPSRVNGVAARMCMRAWCGNEVVARKPGAVAQLDDAWPLARARRCHWGARGWAPLSAGGLRTMAIAPRRRAGRRIALIVTASSQLPWPRHRQHSQLIRRSPSRQAPTGPSPTRTRRSDRRCRSLERRRTSVSMHRPRHHVRPVPLAYGWPGGGWDVNLSGIPGATWIWAPGITKDSTPADNDTYRFTRTVDVPGTPTGGTAEPGAGRRCERWVNRHEGRPVLRVPAQSGRPSTSDRSSSRARTRSSWSPPTDPSAARPAPTSGTRAGSCSAARSATAPPRRPQRRPQRRPTSRT